MKDKEIKNIRALFPWTEEEERELRALFPWTEEEERELAEFKKRAVPIFTPEKQAEKHGGIHLDSYGFPPEDKVIEQHEKSMDKVIEQHEKSMDKAAALVTALLENHLKVWEDVINQCIAIVNAFMDPSATDEQKAAAWPNYKDFSAEEIRKIALTNRRFLEKELPALLKGVSKLFQDNTSAKYIDNPLPNITTKYPISYITPTDKATSYVFCGEQTYGEMQALAMESRRSKKQINTIVSIDFESFNGKVQISGRKELTAYDREVHDAILTLFVNGGNEYITPQMVYQVMTGNPKAFLNPKQAAAISESITRCMYSRVVIDASEEAKAFGLDRLKYDGNLINGKRVTVSLNGNVVECLHVLSEPILYEYADKKNQIGRFDIKLLNSPINKTEEIITLQGYLSRRILSMKGKSALSKTIVYETVYKQIGVEASSDGALRKKKNKVRGQIKIILDFWKENGFILGYCENKRKTELYSISIRI